MSLFKKRKSDLSSNGFSGKSKDLLKTAIEKRKLKLADWLNRRVTRFSDTQKNAGLIIFCILFSGLSFLMLANALSGHRYNRQPLVITHLRPGDSIWLLKRIYPSKNQIK